MDATMIRPLSMDEYNDLVERWNRTGRKRRTERAARCRTEGHDWRDVPVDPGDDPVTICACCLRYGFEDPE